VIYHRELNKNRRGALTLAGKNILWLEVQKKWRQLGLKENVFFQKLKAGFCKPAYFNNFSPESQICFNINLYPVPVIVKASIETRYTIERVTCLPQDATLFQTSILTVSAPYIQPGSTCSGSTARLP
jgi:hypothetical protein